MVADILAAQQAGLEGNLHLHRRSAGRAMADALCDRARAGLDVRLMIDGFGSFATPTAMIDQNAAKLASKCTCFMP